MKTKKYRGFLAGLLIAIMGISILWGGSNDVQAAGETLKVSVDKTDVIIGEEVNVSITLNCPTGLYAAMFDLKYDSSMFTYVSGDAGGGSYAGTIPLNYMDSGVPTSYTWKLKFKAVKTGTSDFTLVGDTFVDKNVAGFTPSYTNASVRVWAEGSNDATLNYLEVAGYTLSPEFAKWTTDYTVYVETEVTSVQIAATATQASKGARVEISGNPAELAYGNNYVTIKSYAPNGKVMTYTINIVRAEPPIELPAWSAVTVDGVAYNIHPEFAEEGIPAGFEATTYDYKGNTCMAGVNATLGLDMLYLLDAERNGSFFLYNKELDIFYPYMQVQATNHSYVILPMVMAEETPEDVEEGQVVIGSYTIQGYVDLLDRTFAYFYGVNEVGEYSWYSYDTVEGSIQRCRQIVETEPEVDPVEEAKKEAEKKYNALLKQKDVLKKAKNMYMIASIVLVVVLLGAVVFIIIDKNGGFKRKKKNEFDL